MAFTIGSAGGHGVVRAEGELDVGNAPALREAVGTALDQHATLVIDLTAVTFMDSVTLGVLIGAYNRTRETGGGLAVACTDDRVRRVFRITGLDKVFALYDTVEAAAAAL
ncbi:STAS domain-containing protein [Dactylosporangium sp. NPDC051485]|uniref:STAS domain-containing protein n=1 Tax=Dactylosporangium sp. NPDC051485 TaxID=3154846 RepID=UPI00342929B6